MNDLDQESGKSKLDLSNIFSDPTSKFDVLKPHDYENFGGTKSHFWSKSDLQLVKTSFYSSEGQKIKVEKVPKKKMSIFPTLRFSIRTP